MSNAEKRIDSLRREISWVSELVYSGFFWELHDRMPDFEISQKAILLRALEGLNGERRTGEMVT